MDRQRARLFHGSRTDPVCQDQAPRADPDATPSRTDAICLDAGEPGPADALEQTSVAEAALPVGAGTHGP